MDNNTISRGSIRRQKRKNNRQKEKAIPLRDRLF